MPPKSISHTILISPATVTSLAALILVGLIIGNSAGDPLSLANIGSRFSLGDPNGSKGYDGQFVYYIAREATPESAAPYLDEPAYRYQRILLPLLARLLSFTNLSLIPWAIVAINILAHIAGTWIVSSILEKWSISRWYALTYGLWVGFMLAIRLDLPEPLAYALVAAAIGSKMRQHDRLSWVFYGLALFAKEITGLFVAAAALHALTRKNWREVAGLVTVSLLPYITFQLWLWRTFGQPGIASGGEMATPFEYLPFMGLLRIAVYSVPYFIAMLAVFGPGIVVPTVWGLYSAGKKVFSFSDERIAYFLLLNSLIMLFLPFSTYRETGGILRFACGLVLSVLLFAGRYRQIRVLNYTLLWMVFNVFLVKS